jgi:CRP-like cAMP-binding protein
MLTHPQLLAVTQQATRRSFEPGASILLPGEGESGLLLVTQGQVEILHRENSTPEVVAELQPGQHISLLDFTEIRELGLEYRAWLRGPVEVLWLGGKAFQQLIAEAPKAGSALRQSAIERSQQTYRKLRRGKEGREYVPTSLG